MLRTPASVLLAALLLLAPVLRAQAASANAKSPAEKSTAKDKAEVDSDKGGADAALAEAKKAYASLRKDQKRRKFRDQWMTVALRFESVADKFPGSPRAADALYNAAELYAELSRISLAKRDLRQAIEAYQQLAEKFPRSNLADDAHWALGKIYRDRQGDSAGAEAEFKAALACKGDMQEKAKSALAELASLPKPKSDKDRSAEDKPKLAKSDSKKEPDRAEPKREERRLEKPEPARLAEAPGKVILATRDEEDSEEEAEAVHIPLPSKGAIDRDRVKAIPAATKSEVPLSVQVGLKVKRVIIDPGHGGLDVGAVGPEGAYEKDVTLAIAEKLKARLEADGYEALMTRESDAFVSLEDRARFANKKKGDLFVSVHCNAMKLRKMRGVETYTLNVTSDQYAIRLAARENASSERAMSDLQFILADLATKANTTDSVRLARAVQSELVEAESDGKERARDLGVKQALFYVLLGVRMPSVLVETAFLSNPEDEKRLQDPQKQQEMADAIAEGVGRFVSERDALATALE